MSAHTLKIGLHSPWFLLAPYNDGTLIDKMIANDYSLAVEMLNADR